MNKKKNNYFGEILKNQSVFNRIFISLMALLVLLILTITFWINHISTRNQQKLIMRSNLARMEAANRTLEQVFDDLAGSMTQLLWSHDILSYMLLPLPEDQNQYYNISQQLTNVSRSAWPVKQVVFYCDYSDKVFQSGTSQIWQLDKYYDADILKLDREEDPACYLYFSNMERKTKTYVITAGKRLFLLQNLFMGKSLGSVVYELNTSIVNGAISNGNGQQDNIMLFNQNGVPILTGIVDYSIPDMSAGAAESLNTITSDQVDEARLSAGDQYYRFTGTRLPWIYLMPVRKEDMQVSLGDTMNALLPAMLLMLAASALVTAYIVRSIYQPVTRLLELAGEDKESERRKTVPQITETEEEKPPKNEFRVLENAYSRAIDQQEEMSRIIENVTPHVIDSLLAKLLMGQVETEEKISRILKNVGEPLPVKGRFLVISCDIEANRERRIVDKEWELYHSSLRALIRKIEEKDCRLYYVDLDRHTIAMLLSFEPDSSAVRIKRTYLEIKNYLLAQSEVLPYEISVECGPIYSHLLDSRKAYLEGLEKIQYQKEHPMSGRDEAEDGEMVSAENPGSAVDAGKREGPDPRKMADAVSEVATLLMRGESSGAYYRLDQLTREIEEISESPEELRENGSQLLHVLVEKAMVYPLTPEELELTDEGRIAAELQSIQDEEELQSYISEYCRKIAHLIYSYNRKSRYKYVEQAKAYIADNYSDSGLALNDVADHVGISSSYLSELWSEQNGDKFTGYLASFRIGKARQLLQNSQLTVKEICSLCGFNSVQNFNRVFKKYTGLTPGQFRESKNKPGERTV